MKNKMSKLIVLLAPLALTACFKMTNQQVSQSSTSVAQSEDPDVMVSNAKTLALVGSTNVIEHMKSITRVSVLNADINNKYREKKDALSVKGDIDSINAPMWIALADLSGEFCNKSVADEVAGTKNFYASVNFAQGPQLMSDTTLETVIGKLSNSMWGRAPYSEETEILKEGFKAQFTTGSDPKMSLVWLCSAMLSSRSAMEF